MAKYYFNFFDGAHWVKDEQGIEFENLELAYLEAFRAGQDIWHESLLERRDPSGCVFEVTDAEGRELLCLPFSEILESCRRGRAQGVRFAPTGALLQNLMATARTKRLASELCEQMKFTSLSIRQLREMLARCETLASWSE